MGNIDDILKLMRKGPQTLKQLDGARINTKSVAAGAADSTFQFPCLTVDTIPIDMATTMARSLDRVYASFVQSWLSLNQVIDISIDRTPTDYLKKFHQNIRFESAIKDLAVEPDDLEGYMEKAYRGEYRFFEAADHSYGILFNVSDKNTRAMLESHKELLREHLSEFNLKPIYEADDDSTASEMLRAAMQGSATKQAEKAQEKLIAQTDKLRAPSWTDRELKRANDMIPYGMQVRLMAVNDAGQFVQYMDFIVGVKTILHPLKSDEVILNIQRALQNKSVLFKLLRWTTGEISLIKNILLDLDSLRFDASSSADGRSPWFGRLRQLKNRKIGVHALTVPHAIIPNASLVISSYEVGYLSSVGIDIRDPKIASKVMDQLFLMTFVIMDDSTDTVEILYDKASAFQTYALESLEREASLNSNKLGKEIGRMISR